MSTPQLAEGSTATFAHLGVEQPLCDALADIGIHHPFPIQEITLPLALARADVIGQARTGTGKTLAFGLPLLQRVDPGERRTVALVIVPTRELCLQVRDDLAQAAARKDVEVLAVYGGRSIEPQMDALRAGAPVVVGTPGRLLDLQQRGALDLSGVTALVLDEADEMLDLGFLPDVERLIESTAAQRQTLLFSATMPPAVVALARRYMSKPTFLRADVEESRIAPATRQHFFSCHRMDKPAVLARILQVPDRGLCVVFTRTKRMADVLASELRDRGIDAAPIHSDLRQESRERALKRFREGKIDVLVATEVAARGLDIDDVTHVVNYDTPDDEKMYLHRIGRTGRAGAAGVAITLAVWNELARVEMIKRALDIDEPTHEVFSTSEILDSLFDLPPRESRTQASAEDWQRAVSRSKRSGKRSSRSPGEREGDREERRGGRRRTPRRGEVDDGAGAKPAAGSGEAKPAARAVGAGDSGRTPAQDADPGEAATRRRVRRRTGEGRTRAADAATAESTADVDGQAPSEVAGQDARRVRRRVNRTKGRDETPSERASTSEDDTAPKRGRDAGRGRSGAGQSRSRDAGRGERDAGRGERDAGRGERDAGRGERDAGRDERGRRGKPSSDGGNGGKSSAQRSGGQRRTRDGGRSGGGRRSRSEGTRSSRTTTRTASRQVDAQEARGNGRPRLRRPLEVVHLP